MINQLIVVLIGAGIGGAIGYFGKCSSGACPLTSTWWRGAIMGGALGLIFFAFLPSNSEGEESKGNIKHITSEQFEAEVVKSQTPVVVDFFATWCGPCKMLSPMLEKTAATMTNEVKFVKVDVDKSGDLAQRFNIQGVPTLIFFKSGKQVDTIVGLPTAGVLKTKIEALKK